MLNLKNNKIIEQYYLPHKKLNETLRQAIQRVDDEISDARFKHICNRDIFIGEDRDGCSRLD